MALQEAGLQPGDVIVSFDGQDIRSPNALAARIEAHRPGDHVSVGWIDSDCESHTATVQLIAGPPA